MCTVDAVRREFEYRRHGTAALFAALNVHDGTVAGWVTDSTRAANFVAFLSDLVAQTPAGVQLHPDTTPDPDRRSAAILEPEFAAETAGAAR